MTNHQPPTFKNVGDCSPNPLRIDAPVCDAGALIRSCTKGASRGYTGIRSAVPKTAVDLTLSWKCLKLGPETLLTQAKTICTFHNFSS